MTGLNTGAAVPILEQLDFVYMRSRDIVADMAWFTSVLGARVVFAIDGMGARVAMLELASGPPRVLLASHVKGDRPILVYRVANVAAATAALKAQGLRAGHGIELPMGSAYSFSGPGGHRMAIYESSRPFVIESFEGRRDF